jgi:hypothetical protein
MQPHCLHFFENEELKFCIYPFHWEKHGNPLCFYIFEIFMGENTVKGAKAAKVKVFF